MTGCVQEHHIACMLAVWSHKLQLTQNQPLLSSMRQNQHLASKEAAHAWMAPASGTTGMQQHSDDSYLTRLSSDYRTLVTVLLRTVLAGMQHIDCYTVLHIACVKTIE